MMRDLGHGWRALRRSPWHTAGTVGVLTIGITLTTVSFAVTDGVLFKPLPFARAAELHLVRADISTMPRSQPPAASWPAGSR